MVMVSVEVAPNSTYTKQIQSLLKELKTLLNPTVVSCVCSTNGRGIISSCSRDSKVIHSTSSTGASVETSHCLEIQPQLADVILYLLDGVGTCPSTCGGVGAWVVWIPDVGCVCGDAGAASGGGDHTADSKASSTVSIR